MVLGARCYRCKEVVLQPDANRISVKGNAFATFEERNVFYDQLVRERHRSTSVGEFLFNSAPKLQQLVKCYREGRGAPLVQPPNATA